MTLPSSEQLQVFAVLSGYVRRDLRVGVLSPRRGRYFWKCGLFADKRPLSERNGLLDGEHQASPRPWGMPLWLDPVRVGGVRVELVAGD